MVCNKLSLVSPLLLVVEVRHQDAAAVCCCRCSGKWGECFTCCLCPRIAHLSAAHRCVCSGFTVMITGEIIWVSLTGVTAACYRKIHSHPPDNTRLLCSLLCARVCALHGAFGVRCGRCYVVGLSRGRLYFGAPHAPGCTNVCTRLSNAR